MDTHNWSEPILPDFEVVDDYDTTVLQLSITSTATKELKDKDPNKQTFTYVKLERDVDGMGGKEFVRNIFNDNPNGAEYRELSKRWKKWVDEVYEIAINIFNDLRFARVPPTPEEVDRLLGISRTHCVAILNLRKRISAGEVKNCFWRQELRPSVVKLCHGAMEIHRVLKDFKEAVGTGIPEFERVDMGYDPLEVCKTIDREMGWIQDPDDLEVVICDIGAFNAHEVGLRKLEALIGEIDMPGRDAPKPWSRDWIRLCASMAIGYGYSARLSEKTFLHQDDAYEWARQELQELGITLGFKLDQPMNAIGASGWDFLQGECHPKSWRDKIARGRAKAPK